jgi:hypothetical protein
MTWLLDLVAETNLRLLLRISAILPQCAEPADKHTLDVLRRAGAASLKPSLLAAERQWIIREGETTRASIKIVGFFKLTSNVFHHALAAWRWCPFNRRWLGDLERASSMQRSVVPCAADSTPLKNGLRTRVKHGRRGGVQHLGSRNVQHWRTDPSAMPGAPGFRPSPNFVNV